MRCWRVVDVILCCFARHQAGPKTRNHRVPTILLPFHAHFLVGGISYRIGSTLFLVKSMQHYMLTVELWH